jgi:hypothetical protein
MSKRIDFINDVSPVTEDFLDDMQELQSRHIDGIRLERVGVNQVKVTIDQQGSLITDSGKQRWVVAGTLPSPVTVSGTSGSRNVYAIGGTDTGVYANTNKAFTLEVSSGAASGTNPRLLGTLDWDGTNVTNLRLTAGQQPPADLYNSFVMRSNDIGGVPLTVRGVTGQTADLIRVGSVSASNDRMALDVNGRLNLPATGSTGGLVIGGDTNLYRSAADTLRTADSLVVDTNLTVSGNASVGGSGGSIGFYGTTPVARQTGYTISNVTTDRTYNADSTSLNELADVVGTLINDLKSVGIIG